MSNLNYAKKILKHNVKCLDAHMKNDTMDAMKWDRIYQHLFDMVEYDRQEVDKLEYWKNNNMNYDLWG